MIGGMVRSGIQAPVHETPYGFDSSLWSLSIDGGPTEELIRFADPGRRPRAEMTVHDDVVYHTAGEFEADIWLMELDWN